MERCAIAHLYVGGGIDYVHGDRGHDTIYGGGGGDDLYGGRGRDMIFGGNGDDFIHGGNGPIVEVGADPNDGDDEIHGGGGNDDIRGGDGHDVIYGGAGFDMAFFDRPLAAYDVDINGDGSVEVTDLVGDGGHDYLTGIQRLVFADDVIDL